MCLIIFSHQPDSNYPLVVAANRDEFHLRPTQAAHFWPQQPSVLAGKDLELGGTWMGIDKYGRFAAVTNFRDPAQTSPAPRSRGELPLDFLTGTLNARDYLTGITNVASQYAGFNLLLGEAGQLWYFSNSPEANPIPVALPPGLYGLSNAQLDTPWPKVRRGKALLQQALTQPLSHHTLAQTTASRQMASQQELQLQGLQAEMDQLLSAPFIVNERYGTRATTTMWLERDKMGQQAHFREASFNAQGLCSGEVEHNFTVSPQDYG